MKQRAFLWLVALLLLLTAPVSGCGKPEVGGEHADEHGQEEGEKGHAEGEHSEDIVLTADAAKIAGIQVQEARRMPMQAQVKAPGTVTNTSQGKAVVTPPVDGRITRLMVSVGDRVRQGQGIATLQSADLAQAAAEINEAQRNVIAAQASAREAASHVDLARARLRTAQQTLGRQLQLARAGAFSQAPLQQAQRDLNEAEAELESARKEEVVHQAQLERAERLFKEELVSRTELEQARLELQQDKIRQQRATRQIDLARQAVQRERTIAERGLLNAREVQAAEAEVRSANLELQQARIRAQASASAVTSAQRAVQNARANYAALSGGGRAMGASITVVAPMAGVVTEREATIGQAVERTTEICEIENLRSVWVTAQVPEKQMALIRKGGPAQVTVNSFPNRIFYGFVQVVGSRLDPKTRTMPVHVLVENADGALRANMFANVALGVGAGGATLAIPRTAVVEDGDRRLVYIAEEGGRYEEKPVELGRIQGELIEIVSGLEAGAKVVTKGAFVLKSEKVKGELKGHEH